MARLLVGATWYETIRSESWSEKDYETVVLAQSEVLFPLWRCVRFNATIVGEDGVRKKPDLALVDRRYRSWWVVEVELAHHDLYGHVIPQIDAFRTGTYGPSHASALLSAAPELDADRVATMVGGEPPGVLVIVDSHETSWRGPLLERRVSLGVVEAFRSAGNTIALRLNGDQPEPHPTILSRCTRSHLRRLWKVHSPGALTPGEDALLIEFEGTESPWHVLHLHDSVMLQANRGDVLTEATSVDLVQREDGGLAFRQVSVTAHSRRRPV